jgi:hypothetical protein
MINMLDKTDLYTLDSSARVKRRQEWRCFSSVCTKDKLGVSTPGVVKKAAEDHTCPDCGDYLVSCFVPVK